MMGFHYDPCVRCGKRIQRSNVRRYCPHCGQNQDRTYPPPTKGPIDLDLPRVCKTCRSRLSARITERQIVITCNHQSFIYDLVGVSSDQLDAEDPDLGPGETVIRSPPPLVCEKHDDFSLFPLPDGQKICLLCCDPAEMLDR